MRQDLSIPVGRSPIRIERSSRMGAFSLTEHQTSRANQVTAAASASGSASRATSGPTWPANELIAIDVAGVFVAGDGIDCQVGIHPMRLDPVNLTTALASFEENYSPRIVARVNDYDVRIAHTHGDHVWHVHDHTDEFFLVLEGRFDVALRTADGTEHTVVLQQGDTFVVPKGVEHKPSSPGGAILMFEPTGTSSTGDRHEGVVPDDIDHTTGHQLHESG